jgi:uncharacterized heparinase superfamily protein
VKKSSRFSLYYHTLRYLKPVQLYGRLWFRFHRPKPNLSASPPLRHPDQELVAWHRKPISMIGPDRFRFLNEDGELSHGWDHASKSKLWRYNLHYFDDLNAEDPGLRKNWHRALFSRWIAENKPGRGTGWEPYPLSLRIVNWIKWSLAVQVRFLARRLEYHLLGNHLLANAKALVFAGLFFDGKEADGWFAKGLTILKRQVALQILGDGGHFERSPMYHAIILEDLIDIVNLLRAFGRQVPESWLVVVVRMLSWLETFTHPDGRIALFNDAAMGVAADAQALCAYAERLGIERCKGLPQPVVRMAQSGYLRCEIGDVVALIDVAEVGPDYLPAHAHADTLSFEFSLQGQRTIVDSGISTYEKSSERLNQRGTAAHNTVIIDDRNSSEVWGGFRVARRARPIDLEINEDKNEIRVSCAHDGYCHLPGEPVHRRQWVLSERELRIRDRVEGHFRRAEARYHFHPEAAITLSGNESGVLRLPGERQIPFRLRGGVGRVEVTNYHPEFNLSLKNHCLSVVFNSAEIETIFDLSFYEQLQKN